MSEKSSLGNEIDEQQPISIKSYEKPVLTPLGEITTQTGSNIEFL